MMVLYIVLCVILAAVCGVHPGHSNTNSLTNQDHRIQDMDGFLQRSKRAGPGPFSLAYRGFLQRNKRAGPGPFSLAYRGLRAWTQLMATSTRLVSRTPYVREYKKYGDYKTARDEFLSFKPKHIVEFKRPGGVSGMSGQVGDRTLVVKDSSDNFFPSAPTIEIYKTKETIAPRVVDKIRYLDWRRQDKYFDAKEPWD